MREDYLRNSAKYKSDCLPKTQDLANLQGIVLSLNLAQCQLEKEKISN